MKEVKLLLDEQDFRKLITGGIVEKSSMGVHIKIALQDIGYYRMKDIVGAEIKKQEDAPR